MLVVNRILKQGRKLVEVSYQDNPHHHQSNPHHRHKVSICNLDRTPQTSDNTLLASNNGSSRSKQLQSSVLTE